MKKKVIAAILATAMTASLAACAAAPAAPAAAPAASGEEAVSDSEATAEAPAAIDLSAQEPVTIKMFFNGSNVTDDSAAMEELNKYLNEKIAVTLEPIWGTWGDFGERTTLALQGGDDVDIYFTSSWSSDEYSKFARDGYWVRLDDPDNDLIAQYGQDAWNLLPTVLTDVAKINGSDGFGVYGVPVYKDIASQNTWDVNVTLLEKYGYTTDDLMEAGFFGWDEILKTVKEGEGASFYPLVFEGAVLERFVDNSAIVTGDASTGFLSYYMDKDDSSKPTEKYGVKILNKYATDEFREFAEKVHEYYEAGYVDPAMANASQAGDQRTASILSGQYLIDTQVYALGYELQASQERGIHVEMLPANDPHVDTSSAQGALYAVSTASKHPDRAVQLLNLLNTDAYAMTLLDYGVEGIHYTKDDDGLITFTEERANYQPWTMGAGNVTLLPPTVDQGVGWYDKFKEYYGGAVSTPILGYAFDPSEVETQYAAVAAIVAQYQLPITCGSMDPDTAIPEFLDKLEAAGINDIIDEANRQLDEFLAAKGE